MKLEHIVVISRCYQPQINCFVFLIVLDIDPVFCLLRLFFDWAFDIVDQKIAWTGFAGSEFKLGQRSYWLHSIRIGVIKCRAAFLIFGQLQIGFIGCTRSLKGLNIKANRTFALADR